ncbi:MAG: MFS transporter [Polyangiaceae bacterium]|nr:MFS transporter [Polyangiaceae bacterium]
MARDPEDQGAVGPAAAHEPAPPREPTAFRRRAHDAAWVSTTYFGEGFPYSVVNNIPEILFTALGAPLGLIGLTSLFHLPWNLKFLWAPFLDQYETKRRWLLAIEVALCAVGVVLALAAGAGSLGLVTAAFLVMAVLSATHDIAIDGFYLEALDTRDQAGFVGFRAMAYKLANLLARGPMLVLAGAVGWGWGFGAAAGVLGLLLGVHLVLLPRREVPKRPVGELGRALLAPTALVGLALLGVLALVEWQLAPARRAWQWLDEAGVAPALRAVPVTGWVAGGHVLALLVAFLLRRRIRARAARSAYASAFVSFMEQPKALAILAFVLTFRAGESFLQKMKSPFFLKELDVGIDAYGFVNGTLGVIASLAGTLVGGWLIARHGLRRWVWPFVLAQNVLHVLYVLLALRAADGDTGLGAITAVITVEHLGEGLGSAVFMTYLLRCCQPAHKAAHMAILTALMSVGFTVAGSVSGFLAEALGYPAYFAFTFVVSIPGMLLLFAIPHLDAPPRTPRAA